MITHYIRFPGYLNKGAIEVSKTAQIPGDYYGLMGVPITALDKIGNGPDSQFEIVDYARPKLNGKATYYRIIIRRKLPPEIEDYIDRGGVCTVYEDDLLVPLRDDTTAPRPPAQTKEK